MIAFFHPSRFCARSGSSWCCLRSLRTLSIHLSLGLPRGLFPPTFIVITCFTTFVSSLLITWPYHEMRFCVTYVVIGFTIASLLNFSFLIRSLYLSVSLSLARSLSLSLPLSLSLSLCLSLPLSPYLPLSLSLSLSLPPSLSLSLPLIHIRRLLP